MNEPSRIWGVNLRAARLRQRLTQAQLAEAVSVGRASVTRWESGTNRPNEVNRVALARALQVDVGDLFPQIGSVTEVPNGMDVPAIDERSPTPSDDHLDSPAETLAVEFAIGIGIGVLAIVIVGLRLRRRSLATRRMTGR